MKYIVEQIERLRHERTIANENDLLPIADSLEALLRVAEAAQRVCSDLHFNEGGIVPTDDNVALWKALEQLQELGK